MLTKADRKYLERHCEPIAVLADRVPGRFARVVIIPAYGEDECLDRAIASVPADPHGELLIIVVLNHREDSPTWVVAANQRCGERLAHRYPTRTVAPGTTVHVVPQGALLCVRTTLPPRQGVGLARKIGCDIGYALWTRGVIATRWLHCTDADAVLPADYFTAIKARPGAALLYPFWHTPSGNPGDDETVARYELSLRYYVLGLRAAGSPYAFHSIGSTVAVDAAAYARVRGFPKRNAAEDFYILNKLSKVGAIIAADSAPIELAGRPSSRVPFGTGRAVLRARGDYRPVCYDPRIFDYVRAVIAAISAAAAGVGFVGALRQHSEGLDYDSLHDSLSRIGAIDAFAAAQDAGLSPTVLLRRMHTWFDSFRTRKLVHELRDAGSASQPVEQAIESAAFIDTQGLPRRASLEALRRRLMGLEVSGRRAA